MSRPEHSVHEGLEPRPLFCNPVLTMLARAIADNAFRDYGTIEELLEIEPPENEMYYLRQNKSVLGKPFFYVVSTGEIEKADTFSRRLRELGVRAGYLRPPLSTTLGQRACTLLVGSHHFLPEPDFSS